MSVWGKRQGLNIHDRGERGWSPSGQGGSSERRTAHSFSGMPLQRHLHADALVHSNGAQGSCGSTEVSVKLSQLRDELKNGSEGLADEEVEAERHKVVCHDDKGGFIRIAGHCTYSGTGGGAGGGRKSVRLALQAAQARVYRTSRFDGRRTQLRPQGDRATWCDA